MKVLKQVAGIDLSQKELAVSLGRMQEDLRTEVYAYKTFENKEKGFIALLEWIKKLSITEKPVCFVMEATGVYYEPLAYWLTDQNQLVHVIMPNKISNFFKTLEVKTTTDKTASQAIAMFGLEKSLNPWKPPKRVYRSLRQVTREKGQLMEERTMLKNQLHAEQAEAFPNENSIQRMKVRIQLLDDQEKEIMAEIAEIVKQDEAVNRIVLLICTLPGVGLLTAATILAETNGFELIRNKKQLTSYAGLDVREKESGTSVKGKAKISKKGNKYLRKAMYFPALTAIRHDERFKAVFARLVARHGIKMKAAVAIQRKLLEMAYSLYKTNTPYDKQYLKHHDNQVQDAA